jgi:hypothetical protein
MDHVPEPLLLRKSSRIDTKHNLNNILNPIRTSREIYYASSQRKAG